MSDRFGSLMRAFDKDMSLGLGIVVVIIGFILRFVPPIEILVEMWLFSLVGTMVLGLGFLLVVVGLICFLTDKDPVFSLNRQESPLSQKKFEKKYPGICPANSSATVLVIETLGRIRKPMNRKEIAEQSKLSNAHIARVLRSFIKKGYVLEFQVRGMYYYTLAEKGIKLSQDIQAATQAQKPVQFDPMQHRLKEGWLQRKVHGLSSSYYIERQIDASPGPISGKERILRQQLVLIFGFLGGLFVHFGLDFEVLTVLHNVQAMPFLLALTAFVWLVSSIFCAIKVAGALGVTTLALAWMSGFIVAMGDPLTSLGIPLLMSSMTIGAFATFYS
jgi:DNA-binding MarR family transcriptional regulator